MNQHHILRWSLTLLVALGGYALSNAQITLHEATNITQTKATLSADFPDLSVEHGFQYKYGTLPEIDDFSKLALSPLSDPVQINTTGNYAWSARTAKGWVESKSGLSVGQSSVMSATVNFAEPTEVTFEWSVDSEEGFGILSFIIDGETVNEISGAVDFTKVSYAATAGEHTLQWQYKKSTATNVGLDLGMVRNINLQNTTEGEWITESTIASELQLLNLYPGKSYLFRAYNNTTFSNVKAFKTIAINIKDIEAETTQSKIKLSSIVEAGDASIKQFYNIRTVMYGETEKYANLLFSDDGYGVDVDIEVEGTTGYTPLRIVDGVLQMLHNSSSGNASINVILSQTSSTIPINFQFEARGSTSATNTGGAIMYVWNNGQKILVTSYESTEFKSYSFNHNSYGYKILNFSPSRYSYVSLKNLTFPDLPKKNGYVDSTNQCDLSNCIIESLKSNTAYKVRIGWSLDGDETEEINYSDWIYFTTLPAFADTLSVIDTKQASATIRGKVDGGDATIIAEGLQYRDASGTRWTDYPKDITETELSQNITRLRPNTAYHYRSYIQAQDCDTVFSEIGEFTTLAVEALKPTIVRLAQHEAELQGKVRFGDASIYQRGMQFRKSGETAWEEVEDGGNDSTYILVKKGLEMGAKYEARTYIQPAGCDIIYSDILEFTTLDYYFTGHLNCLRTQTTVEFSASVAELDKDIEAEYGFEYFLYCDGFFENADSFVNSDTIRVPAVPTDGLLKATITGLTPQYGLRFRAYAKINGEYIYYTGYPNGDWKYAGTDRATINVTVKELTQTSLTLELDATQDGDAVVSQIEYAFANSVQDTGEYQVCGNELTINNLTPDTKYNLRFRGTVNGRLCPLLINIEWEYSWFEFTTKAVSISAIFTDITQTKATMIVDVNSGDAVVTDLKYSLNYGTYTDCGTREYFTGLSPETQYTVYFRGKINGVDYSWTKHPGTDKAYTFTTKSVSVQASATTIYQTAATVSWNFYCGDATYVSSGIEYGVTTNMTETLSNESDEVLINELMPNTTYHYRAYVETEEGGKKYSSSKSFTTSAINCATLPVSSISNRSATMNGTIDCDDYSSAEFGFQWKQMEGWISDPAFTKGHKQESGEISVALVNGMLEPNTDYQYRTAVRYQGNIYPAGSWATFRTESEFVYYPATVYTIIRTDRENNSLVLCGYYVAGSETVTGQGYEYWSTGSHNVRTMSTQSPTVINTDESMQHSLMPGELPAGQYSVRAFVTTESGNTIYGATLGFYADENGYSGIAETETDDTHMFVENSILKILNANGLSCWIYSINGILITEKHGLSEYEEFNLTPQNIYIIRLSNGMVLKARI